MRKAFLLLALLLFCFSCTPSSVNEEIMESESNGNQIPRTSIEKGEYQIPDNG